MAVLVITGGSTGIGAETARHAVADGWQVALGARSADKLADLAAELGGPEHALPVTCDVTEWDDCQGLIATAIETYGAVDAVFANAGFGAKRGFLEESPEHWRSMVLTNVYGAALTIRAVLPHMLERDSGHIVLTSSIAGRRVLPGSLYSATKWAVSAMAEALRAELRQMQSNETIRVTSVAPGSVDTPFFENTPATHLLAEDVARAVLYALDQPPHVDVNEIMIRPVGQKL